MFPLKNYYVDKDSLSPVLSSTQPGGFGYKRKYDIHTGIDIYCDVNEPVYAVEDGMIVDILQFTGFEDTPWWNDTWAVQVYHKNWGTVVYGEIKPNPDLKIGHQIKEGDLIGNILTVLKKDKGKNPTNMLHFELYKGFFVSDPVVWELDDEKPHRLLNPEKLLKYLLL